MTNTRPMANLTNQEFDAIEDKIDALRRRARRAPQVADAETIAAWDAAWELPQIKHVDRVKRDEAMLAVAIQYGLVVRP